MVALNVLEMTVGLADLLMVRPFGSAATAAVGVSRQVGFLVESAAVAVSTGVITLVSQGVGARSSGQVEGAVRQSGLLVLLLGVPVSGLGFLLSRLILIALNADVETVAHAEPYLRIYFLGIVFLWGSLVSSAIFRGSGDAITPLKIAVGVNVINVALNYVLIYGVGPLPAFEVPGAAMGTVAARVVACLVYLALLLRGTGHVRLRFGKQRLGEGADASGAGLQMIARIMRIGVPIAVAGLLRNGSRIVFLGIVGTGAIGMSFHAAAGVGLQLRMLSIMPALAFQVATATLVGQAIGRGDHREAEALGQRSMLLLTGLMLIVVAAVIGFADQLARLFIATRQDAQLGAQVLRWFAVAQFFSALSIGTQGALAGAGDTRPPMHYTLLSQWCFMLPLAYLTYTVLEWGPRGPLFAWMAAPVLSAFLMRRRFRSRRWQWLRV